MVSNKPGNLSNPSSFFSGKEYFSCCRTNFLSPCVLAIALVLFSNYYAPFCNVYYLLLFEMFIFRKQHSNVDSYQRRSKIKLHKKAGGWRGRGGGGWLGREGWARPLLKTEKDRRLEIKMTFVFVELFFVFFNFFYMPVG